MSVEFKTTMRNGTVLDGRIEEDGTITLITGDCTEDHHEAEAYFDVIHKKMGGERIAKPRTDVQHHSHSHTHSHKHHA